MQLPPSGGAPAPTILDFESLAAKVGLSTQTRDLLLTAMDPDATSSFPVKVLSKAKDDEIEALVAAIRIPGVLDSGSGSTGPPRPLAFLQANAVRLLFDEARAMFAPVVAPAAISSTAIVPATSPSSSVILVLLGQLGFLFWVHFHLTRQH